MEHNIEKAEDYITFGPVHLNITDPDVAVDFWTNVIGLKLHKDTDAITLGTDHLPLVVLHPTATAKYQNGFSGLYHLAIHVENEREFALMTQRLLRQNISFSPTDHTFSKALYLYDPDGILVEITLETPERFKEFRDIDGRIYLVDNDGKLHSPTESLDLKDMLNTIHSDEKSHSISENTKIGHVHLYVSNLRDTEAFYTSLGFEKNRIYDSYKMGEMAAGGIFRHRIAFNNWQSENRPQAPENTAGMSY